MQENNCVIITKKGKGELPLFCGNGEQVIPLYGLRHDCLRCDDDDHYRHHKDDAPSS